MHVEYNHKCEKCEAFYIPYDIYILCPRCGLLENERFDYIPQAIASLQFNKEFSGSYIPDVWWSGSLGDHILRLLFELFEGYESQITIKDFGVYLETKISEIQWGSQYYLREHVRGIAHKVRQGLKTQDPKIIDGRSDDSVPLRSSAPTIESSHLPQSPIIASQTQYAGDALLQTPKPISNVEKAAILGYTIKDGETRISADGKTQLDRFCKCSDLGIEAIYVGWDGSRWIIQRENAVSAPPLDPGRLRHDG